MSRALPTLAMMVLASVSARAEDGATLRGQVDVLCAARGLVPTETLLNYKNTVLRLPHLALTSEVRPSVEAQVGSWLTVIARPRLQGGFAMAQVTGDWPEGESALAVTLPELYGTWQASDWLALSWGLQNFQWGPGELASPSNRLFHETGLLRDPLTLVQGRHLLRVNLSSGRELSVVGLVELSEVEEQAFVAREDFDRSAHLKVEYAEETGRWLVGVTVSAWQEHEPAFGEYAQLQLNDLLAVYADASHERERRAWYPGRDTFVKRAFDEDELELFSTALVGARLSFEGGVELRGELLFHQAGWDEDELKDAAALALATRDVEAWLAPGFELVGQHFVYLALRAPELPPMKKLTLQPRLLWSATDGSAAAFVTLSAEAGERTTAFLSAYASVGEAHDELSRIARAAVTFGVINTW